MTKMPPSFETPLEPSKIVEATTRLQMSGLGALNWLGTRWLEAMGDASAEWVGFLAERIGEDVRTQHALLHAKSFSEVQHIQAAFLQKALDDYRDETGKLLGLYSETMAELEDTAAETKES